MGALLAHPVVSEGGGEPDDLNLGFSVGEEIEYKIYWGVIPVGYAVASTSWLEEDGRRLIAIRFKTRTNKVLSKLYPVDDVVESIVDPETFLPIRFSKTLSEGRYRCNEVTRFDHAGGKAYWYSKIKDRKKEYPVEATTRDLVSFMYYTRLQKFKTGEKLHFQVMADEKIYDLSVRVKKREKVKTVDGDWIKSVQLVPKASFEGLFVHKGKMWLWISEEKPSVLIKMAAKVPVASIKLVLADVRHSGDDASQKPIPESK